LHKTSPSVFLNKARSCTKVPAEFHHLVYQLRFDRRWKVETANPFPFPLQETILLISELHNVSANLLKNVPRTLQ